MQNTALEDQYIQEATDYINTKDCTDPAVFINGVGFGLNLREKEISDLKQRISELLSG